MAWARVSLACLLLALLTPLETHGKEEEEGKKMHRVMVISLDGFGHDYLSKYDWKHLDKLYLHGSHPETFANQFTTKTFPNHFSIATGVYEDIHGVVANMIYDPTLNKTLQIQDKGFFNQNPDIVPLWTLNEENGGHTACIMWPGCDRTFRGTNVTYSEPYVEDTLITKSIDKAMEWMTDVEAPANLVFLYHEEPDVVGHIYGPNSTHVLDELKKIDEGIGYLYRLLTMYQLLDTTDVIILSDHGMASFEKENIIDLDTIVDSSLYHYSGGSPVMLIWQTGDILALYDQLQKAAAANHYKVYLKKNFPKEWHYTDNSRISRIVLVANPGYVFQDWKQHIENYKKKGLQGLTNTFGEHGYPTSVSGMEPIFVAAGPSFKRGFIAPPFSNTDIYLLLCQMLSFTPGPNNGTLEAIGTILSHPVGSSLTKPLLIALGSLVLVIGLIGIIACALAKRDRRAVSADSLINGYIHRRVMRTEGHKYSEEDASEEEHLLEAETVTVDL